MKKLLLILTMLVMMLPSMCFADPVIKSDSRTFNPLTGVYDLQGNVFVQFPAHDTTLTITGDATLCYGGSRPRQYSSELRRYELCLR